MQTISMSEILDLYKICNANTNGSECMRNTLNLGTLYKTLDMNNLGSNKVAVDSVWINNTLI